MTFTQYTKKSEGLRKLWIHSSTAEQGKHSSEAKLHILNFTFQFAIYPNVIHWATA